MSVMKKSKQIDFIVNTGDPSSSAANKKRVRSVAALKSWPERRRKVFAQLGNSRGGHGAFLVDTPEPKKKEWSPSARPSKKAATETVVQIAGPPRPPPPAATSEAPATTTLATSQDFVTADIDPGLAWKYSSGPRADWSLALYHQTLPRIPATKKAVDQLNSWLPADRCQCDQCHYMVESVGGVQALPVISADEEEIPVSKKRRANATLDDVNFPMAMALMASTVPSPSNGKADPFNCYPVPYQPWFDKVLHYMLKVYAPRGWPALKITNAQGEHWEWYMTQLALAEPALFYVRLLFGSGEMVKYGSIQSEIKYWLRVQAIRCINEAIMDPERSCSDALILAIGRIALHEHMYGDRYASFNVHRPAQKRMIEMRGGMQALQIPELVKRLMRWSDRIMAVGSGTPRMIEDEGPDSNFSLWQSVNAIQKWTPAHMPLVRSKIKISDLVNEDEPGKQAQTQHAQTQHAQTQQPQAQTQQAQTEQAGAEK